MSGVPYEIISNHTTADHPMTVQFVREEQQRWRAMGVDYTISHPMYKGQPTSMWDLIVLKGPPTRLKRWCCEYLKKQATPGRFLITGVRWAESTRRKNTRAVFEIPVSGKERIMFNDSIEAHKHMSKMRMGKNTFSLNPIVDWSDADVWEFHRTYGIPHNPFYDLGYQRVGCIGCPMGDNKRELEKFPEFKKLYLHAFDRCVASKPLSRYGWRCGQDLYDWWVSGKAVQLDENQLSIFEQPNEAAGDDGDTIPFKWM